MSSRHDEMAGFIWSIADLLRGDFKTSEYGSVILPLTVVRRLDCLLEPTRAAAPDFQRRSMSGLPFYNTSEFTLSRSGSGLTSLLAEPEQVASNLRSFIGGFSAETAAILSSYDFDHKIGRLERSALLYPLLARFAALDLSLDAISDQLMGDVFEELIRRFSEISGEIAGEFYSPSDVTKLMVGLLLTPDRDRLTRPDAAVRILDPVCGTGGMLWAVERFLRAASPQATTASFGQELNAVSYAICRSALLVKNQESQNIALGNSIGEDLHRGMTFDYLVAHPPFGLNWKIVHDRVAQEAKLGFAGRFGAGLPRVNDGQLLFLQHLIAHMKPIEEGGSRVAVVFNGSPLFTGAAGSGESNIRRWVLENDLLEGIIALPDQLFPNTGILTYVWILSNRKEKANRGRVILLNAREHCARMRGSLGGKRQYITDEQIDELTRLYREAAAVATASSRPGHSKVRLCDNTDFGYQRVVVERPLRLRFEVTADAVAQVETARPLAKFDAAAALLDALRSLTGQTLWKKADFESRFRAALVEAGVHRTPPAAVQRAVLTAVSIADSRGEVQTDQFGGVLPDPNLRTDAKAPLWEDVGTVVPREVTPRFPDAWVDQDSLKIGYEIPLALFVTTRWPYHLEPLEKVARQVAPRPVNGAESQLPLLRARDLQLVEFASELSEFPAPGALLAPCSDGDVVGLSGNWRLLPAGFGTALTPLTVLRLQGHSGRVLCEWLNSVKLNEYGLGPRVSMTVPVPVAAIMDPEFDQLLEELHDGRRSLGRATSRILPNIFRESTNDIEDVRRGARSAASEARLIDELVRPLEDPLWRAEWSYPYHVAALARQYRIAAAPAARKDGILKLGEGIARTLGILALAVQIRRRGSFPPAVRDQFRNGATFGMWLRVVTQLVEAGAVPELRELDGVLGPGGAYEMLHKLQSFRNVSHHAHGVRSQYQLEDEISQLEPILMSSLESVSWLSGLRWELVDQCRFLGGGNQLIGERLRGSHPDWEPFTRFSSEQLAPNRIYVESPSSGAPLDLWPLASGELCSTCGTRELFLLDRAIRNRLVLRSLKEHLIYRDLE